MTSAYITDARFAAHNLVGHVEYAGRLTAIQQTLSKYGLPERMVALTPDPATEAQIRAVHDADYVGLLALTESQKGMQLGPDTYVLPQSFGVAKLSSGAAVRGVDAVLRGEASHALVCARPPGHHLTKNCSSNWVKFQVSLAISHEEPTRMYTSCATIVPFTWPTTELYP